MVRILYNRHNDQLHTLGGMSDIFIPQAYRQVKV